MAIPMTQILAPHNITCKLAGTTAYSAGEYMNHFPTFKEHMNEINIAGSNCSGKFLGIPTATATSLTLKGSGGGNLSGTPDVIYINMTGTLEIKANDIASSQVLTNSSIIKFTSLLQMTITGQSALLALIYPYGEVFHTGAITTKVLFGTDTIKLEHSPISVTYANCTRYICLGDLTLTFILQ